MTPAGPAYDFTELRQLWLASGGAPAHADVAAAIALAESGGCRYALAGPVDVRPQPLCHYTHTFGENSYGLWQINIAPGANPQYGSSDLFDPTVNVRAAITLSANGSDFGAWSTFNSQAYLAFLPAPDSGTLLGRAGRLVADPFHVLPNTHGAQHTVPQVHLDDAWSHLMHALGHDFGGALKRARATGRALRRLPR